MVQLLPLVMRTSNDRVQLPEAAKAPPVIETAVPPAGAETLVVPPQVVLTFGEFATTKAFAPVCMGSINDKLVNAIVLPLLIVMVTRLMPFTPTELGLNCLLALMALLTLTPVEATTSAVLDSP